MNNNSDHYDGKHFFNPGLKIHKTFKQVVKMLGGSRNQESWPKFVANLKKPVLAENLEQNECHITYVNHATHLIQLQNLNILTDPIFSKRAGPASLVGPKRVREPGIALNQLPPIHVVLVSHNHYDHMDLPSLIKLEKLFHPLFIVPLGNKKYLARKKIHRVHELDWWESYELSHHQKIILVPAIHWSKRTLNDENQAFWGGFWIDNTKLKIYFAGDTSYGDIFNQMREKLGAPDISILPIGSYEPQWFMKEMHMNPEEAVKASLDLQSKLSIATHHQTFRLSYEGYLEPVQDLKASLKQYQIPENVFLAPENGETVIYTKSLND